MKSRVESIREKVCAKLRSRHERIYPKPKQGLFNFRCFDNTVQFALNCEKPVKIFECIYIDGDHPCLHYIIKDGDEYQEVTIGWQAECVEYYLIREVPKEDWKSIGNVFQSSLKSWYYEFTNWFDRSILRIRRVC